MRDHGSGSQATARRGSEKGKQKTTHHYSSCNPSRVAATYKNMQLESPNSRPSPERPTSLADGENAPMEEVVSEFEARVQTLEEALKVCSVVQEVCAT